MNADTDTRILLTDMAKEKYGTEKCAHIYALLEAASHNWLEYVRETQAFSGKEVECFLIMAKKVIDSELEYEEAKDTSEMKN